jgi:HK97 family phage prohead protease
VSTQSFFRAVPAQIERTGPRQLTGLLMPYDVVAQVLDELPDGQIDAYQEGFRRGAFAPQANAKGKGIINKINLVHRHGPDGLGYLGPFTALREEADGLYGDARILPTLAENVGALLEEGVDELSVEFRLPRAEHTVEVDGVRWRTRAHLDQVALEPKGAYTTARVLQYRSEMDDAQQERAAKQAEEAEAQQAAAAAAAAQVAEAERLEREAEEAAERRREWEALTGRLDAERDKQQQLVREYGVTRPGGLGSHLR